MGLVCLRNSETWCAYLQSFLVQCLPPIATGHIFVKLRSGAVRFSLLPCAKGHRDPFLHRPCS